MEMDGATYYPKPMNCPFHVMIYRVAQRSYRELPLRLFELGTVYRYELSGAVHGLLRSRGLHPGRQPHLLHPRGHRRRARLAARLRARRVLRAFGFDDFQAKLSTRPPEKSVGDDELWDAGDRGAAARARGARARLRGRRGRRCVLRPEDRRRRARTPSAGPGSCRPSSSTSTCPSASTSNTSAHDGEPQAAGDDPPGPARARSSGSSACCIEHYAGAFPAWLAPVQVRVLPGRRRPRGLRRTRSPTGSGPPASGSTSSAPTSRSASGSATARSRSSPTCSSSATTTSPTAPSASTRGAATSERDVALDDFVARLGRRGRRDEPDRPTMASSALGRLADPLHRGASDDAGDRSRDPRRA